MAIHGFYLKKKLDSIYSKISYNVVLNNLQFFTVSTKVI